jgi:hypothetical protein
MAWNPEDLHHDVMERAVRGFAKGGLVSDYKLDEGSQITKDAKGNYNPILQWKKSDDLESSYMKEKTFLNQRYGDSDGNLVGVVDKLNEIATKHGFTINDLLNVINVETNFTYSTNAQNPKSNAIGLIQFTKEGTDDKGDFKWIGKGGQIDRNKVYIEDIKTMNPIQQLELVDRYFDQMHVKNGYEHPSLTVAVGKKAQGKGMTDVLYHKGSREWEQNPNWRVNGTGPITRESILKHYDGLKKYG